MKKTKGPLFQKLGVSYTISAVIITVTTITLVIVAASYAYQMLEQQRGESEFEVAKKTILTFDDALENIAWKLKAARTTRFTVDYGQLELIPNAATLTVNASVGNYYNYTEIPTGFIRYSIRNKYVRFWEGYKSYALGDENLIVANSTQSFGRALIEQASGWVNITLNYRVRAMKTWYDNETKTNYVDIWIIKVKIATHWVYVGNFDLKARCSNVSTITSNPYPINGEVKIDVSLGNESSQIEIEELDPGNVVFNFIVAEVEVTV